MLILKKNDSAVPFRVRLFFVAAGRAFGRTSLWMGRARLPFSTSRPSVVFVSV